VRSVLQDTSRPLPDAKAAVDLGEAFASVAEHVKPAVVFIKSERRERVSTAGCRPVSTISPDPASPQIEQGSGSGFIVSQDGYILTNNHVVQGADRVTVRLLDNREFTAKTVGTDPTTDVAVIKIQAAGLPTVRLGDADSTRIGNWVLAIGNPLGEAFTFTVTAGIVSAKAAPGGLNSSRYAIQDFIQTDAAINPGTREGRWSTCGARSSASMRPSPVRPDITTGTGLPSRSISPHRHDAADCDRSRGARRHWRADPAITPEDAEDTKLPGFAAWS